MHQRQAELHILESLKFSSMNTRHETIAEAHKQTFDWIFRDPEDEHKPWSNFSEWLKHENGIYWIHGKPGSGKSNLMRYIVQDSRSHEYARTWAQNVPLELPYFFFWNSGDVAQRSQSGLLRTLLHQILERNCDLIPAVFPKEWQAILENIRHDVSIKIIDWSLYALMDAFKLLISETPGNLKFCFFIDGVDENEGDCWKIAEYFCDLSTSKHVKFCLSSRPETGLLETFGKMPQLRLQDLTALDISIYVQDKLESNSQMQSLMESNLEGVSRLIKQVVLDGSGIFLWIKLVVKSLLSGLRKRDDIALLWARLHEMPEELDDLYGHMLSSIDPRYIIEASKLFQMASGDPLASFSIGIVYACYILSLKFFEKAISDDELSACFRTPPDNYREDFSHILRTRCGGLLEISGLSEEMIYIHRTAHDYIKNPQTWQALLDHTADLEFNTNFTFAAMLLQTVKSYTNNDSSKWIDMGSLRLIWTYIPQVISGIESTRAKRHILALVEEFDKAGQSLLEFFMPPDRQVKHWSNFDYQYGIEIYLSNMSRYYGGYSAGTSNSWHIADLLSACVHKDFELYVKMKIASEPQLMEGTYDPPLAALTFLRPPEDSHMNLRLLVFLLKHNAELNDIYLGHSLWRMWLHLVHAKVSKRPKGYIAHQMDVYLVMEITIRRGTDLDTCCLTCLEEEVTLSRIYQDHNYTKRLQKHGKAKHGGRPLHDPSNASNSEDLTDSEEVNASKSQQEPWEARHSLEQIIKDIFDEEHPNLALKLLTLVAEKRAEKAAIEKQARNELSCRKKGRKQKRKNKKGEGKREMIA